MFEQSRVPRLFGLAPGIDFPAAFVAGLIEKFPDPLELSRVQVILNTQRMDRRVRAIFDAGPATLLPQISLVTSVLSPLERAALPTPVAPLRRRLELTQLVSRLLDSQPDLAPRASLFDLSNSLADLMDEMQGEGVSPDVIRSLDVSDQSGHWARTLEFLTIVQDYFDPETEAPDVQALQRRAVLGLLKSWAETPPDHPIILAGSTGSRGTTALLMQGIARLPQGAVVLPGFDFDMPNSVWDQMTDGLSSEDHPQFRFARVMQALDLTPDDIKPWHDTPPVSEARNRLVSLSLRPAPVTDQWLAEGPDLGPLEGALADVTLLEAPTIRSEALAIALRLRRAAEDGQTAALITPDRMLTRQVTAALDRWNILPDDSAGIPLQLTPPGRFLRHVAALFQRELTAEALLALLKHPLTHSGADRNKHLLLTRDLELYIRKKGVPFPSGEFLLEWATAQDAPHWGQWLGDTCAAAFHPAPRALSDWLDQHLALAERLAAGPNADGSGGLWDQKAGRETLKTVTDLAQNTHHGGEMSAADYTDLFGAILSQGELRDRDAPHPNILIWGTLEARVQGADLLILGGLNEASWPEMPSADPWLNRKMRHDAGLLLPERRIGLSAHDYQQAVAGSEVWLTRSVRSDEAETVPSRWLNRLLNLLRGLPPQNGPQLVEQMQERGNVWIAQTRALERPISVALEPRPSPAPPLVARPKQLSVTEIPHLIRDPYAIYARHVLRLRALEPLQRAPDALLRGIALHDVLETFVKDTVADPSTLKTEHLLKLSAAHLETAVPWPATRALWQARMQRVAPWFVSTEHQRQKAGTPVAFERHAKAPIKDLDFALTAMADRIDRDPYGDFVIYDYKTGTPPSKAQQRAFEKQLLLEAALVDQGAFENLPPADVSRAAFIGLGAKPAEVDAPIDEESPAQTWARLAELIRAYSTPDRGYTARRALQKDTDAGRYDHLARFGEWDVTDEPETQVLT